MDRMLEDIHQEDDLMYVLNDLEDFVYEDVELDGWQMYPCVVGSLDSLKYRLLLSVCFALCQRLIFIIDGIPPRIQHAMVSLLGILLLYCWVFSLTFIYFLSAIVLVFSFILVFSTEMRLGYGISLICISSMIAMELLLPDPSSVRGVAMILTMKMCSLSFDMDDRHGKMHVSFLETVSFLLNPSTILFGPALPFMSYKGSMVREPFMNEVLAVFGWSWSLVVAILCMLYSSCVSVLLFPDLLRHYASAQSFRFSHYFICFWAQALSGIAGMDSPSVTSPFHVEIPRSISEVVIVWNVPMHRFLVKYVYMKVKRIFPSAAILSTFFVSSLFHGLNGQLSAVLVSLGFIAYGENRVRNALSRKFSACVRARRCDNSCGHKRNASSVFCICFNMLFCLLSVYHLIYLGAPFDDVGQELGYPFSHTLSVWSSHYYASHIIALLVFLISFIIKV